MKTTLLTISLLFALPVLAQTNEKQAYCGYIQETANAQALYYKAPTGVAGVTQPNTGTTPQMYVGVQESILGWRKAALVRQSAQKDCELYSASHDVMLKLQYTTAELQKLALYNRLVQISAAVTHLDNMIVATEKRTVIQEATLPELYILQGAKAKLLLDKSQTQLDIIQLYTPELSSTNIRTLLSEKQSEEVAKQAADNRLAKVDNWDINLEGGLHQQIHPFIAGKPGFYGAISAKWNFGSKRRDRAIDAASRYYEIWKYNQESDAIRQAAVLRNQLRLDLDTNNAQLKSLQATYSMIEAKLKATDLSDSHISNIFASQLTVDQISTKVEIGNTEFRIAQLQQYLQDNF